MPTELETKTEEFIADQKKLHDAWDETGPDNDVRKINKDNVNGLETSDTVGRVAFLQAENVRLNALGKEVEALRSLVELKKESDTRDGLIKDPGNGMLHPGGTGGPESKDDTLGSLYVKSEAFAAFHKGNQGVKAEVPIDLKTVFQTGAGWAPEQVRLNRVELDPQRPITVVDRIPQLPTSQETIRYMEETTFTNNAVETSEITSATPITTEGIGEAALALTERTQAIEWIPVFLPVTMQQMEDVAGIEAYINQRLTYMIRARLDLQILRGDGNTPNLLGTNNVSGIGVQALGQDPITDAIFKGLNLVRINGFANPSDIFMHPSDWEGVRLLRTADGIYIMGSALDAGAERMWGVPVHLTTAALENTATLGDYRNFSTLYQKKGIMVSATDSHGFDFTNGRLAIKAEMRVAMVHYRPEAFATVTGI